MANTISQIKIVECKPDFPICASESDGYHARSATVRLDAAQAATLHRLFIALQFSEKTLNNGKKITSAFQSLNFILEEINRSLPSTKVEAKDLDKIFENCEL